MWGSQVEVAPTSAIVISPPSPSLPFAPPVNPCPASFFFPPVRGGAGAGMDSRARRLSSFSSSLPPSPSSPSPPPSFFFLLPPTAAAAAVAAADTVGAALPLPTLLLLDGVRLMSEEETLTPGRGGRRGGIGYSHVERKWEKCTITQGGREGEKEGLTNLWWLQRFVVWSAGRKKRGRACRGVGGRRKKRRR